MAQIDWMNGTRAPVAPVAPVALVALAALAGLHGAAACGGDDDGFGEEGFYQLTRHTVNNAGCGAEGDPVDDFSHFQLVAEELFGQRYLAFGTCDSADQSSCESRGIFGAFVQDGGELVRIASASSGGGDFSCFLGFERATIAEQGDSLVIEWFSYGEEDDTVSEEACDPDEAEARGTDMMCESYEVMVGTRVP